MKETRIIGNWKVYHLVQPYFFSHHHFHKRKVQVLRDSGLDAQVLSFVPKSLHQKNRQRYDVFKDNATVKLMITPFEFLHTVSLFLFLLTQVLKGEILLIHVLRVNPTAIILLRFLPFVRSRIRYIQEYEGDTASEFVYAKEYCESPRPPEKPSGLLNKLKYSILLGFARVQVGNADGLVLMSQEHINLWEARLNKELNTTALPTLPAPQSIRFDQGLRDKIRKELGVRNSLVLTYVGNVICKWQRRDAMCAFVKELSEHQTAIRFLAMVRVDDVDLMKETIKKYGLEDITILKTVAPEIMYQYLSAGDVAMFLRHEHTMNKVVTSGKLGEYLAAGLPVITTGNNAAVLNNLIKELNAGHFIQDDLAIDENLLAFMSELLIKKDSAESRKKISSETQKRFSEPSDPFTDYSDFIKNVLTDK